MMMQLIHDDGLSEPWAKWFPFPLPFPVYINIPRRFVHGPVSNIHPRPWIFSLSSHCLPNRECSVRLVITKIPTICSQALSPWPLLPRNRRMHATADRCPQSMSGQHHGQDYGRGNAHNLLSFLLVRAPDPHNHGQPHLQLLECQQNPVRNHVSQR